MIEVTGLEIFVTPSRNLLSSVNFQVSKGEILVIMGLSGSGKTMLLKSIAGLFPYQAGSVKLGGKVGMLFQKNALFDSLTVSENLSFVLREGGIENGRNINEKVKHYLNAVGLIDFEHHYPAEISGGMQKRLGIARALVLEPEIILYDDPTAGLDPITGKLIAELIIWSQKKNNSAVIAVTNEMNRAFQMATRFGIILDHQILFTGDVEETKNFKDLRVQNFIRGVGAHGS
jgi:phospholipid/cholesterol/gamma-HCH transport system ATP-binding protein